MITFNYKKRTLKRIRCSFFEKSRFFAFRNIDEDGYDIWYGTKVQLTFQFRIFWYVFAPEHWTYSVLFDKTINQWTHLSHLININLNDLVWYILVRKYLFICISSSKCVSSCTSSGKKMSKLSIYPIRKRENATQKLYFSTFGENWIGFYLAYFCHWVWKEFLIFFQEIFQKDWMWLTVMRVSINVVYFYELVCVCIFSSLWCYRLRNINIVEYFHCVWSHQATVPHRIYAHVFVEKVN